MNKDKLKRFTEKYVVHPETGCWNWVASCDVDGYGNFDKGKSHRISYEHYVGEIPEGLMVRHKCNNARCCNPLHLRLGTAMENARDRVISGRSRGFRLARASTSSRMTSSPRRKILANITIIESTGCWLWNKSKDRHGYGQVFWKSKNRRCHKLSYESFVGPIPSGAVVRHSCDVRHCCNPDHLSVGTMQQNSSDMVGRGRQCRGSKSHLSRLSESDVALMKAMLSRHSDKRSGVQAFLGRWFCCGRNNVSEIARGKTWSHIA